MKKSLFLLMFFSLFVFSTPAEAQVSLNSSTKIGIILYSNDAETIWNALRLANYAKTHGDEVNIFLLGKGVELDKMVKENENLSEQTQLFLDKGGNIMGCGTCLISRKQNEPQYCKFSSMADLYEMIKNSDQVITF